MEINHHTRISRLQKLLISKSENPKIANSFHSNSAIFNGFLDLKSNQFFPYDILSMIGLLLNTSNNLECISMRSFFLEKILHLYLICIIISNTRRTE